MDRGRLHGLDAIRGIAALMVFAHHAQVILKLPAVQFAPGFAVNLFFMLSGFVMTRTYEERLASGELGATAFLKARYTRLAPMMAVGASLGLLWAIITFGLRPDIVLSLVAVLAFLPALWMPGQFFLLNGPTWSLFIEVCLNALHALTFARTRTSVLVLLCAVGFATHVAEVSQGYESIASNFGEVAPALFRGAFCYLAGIIIYRTYGAAPLPHAKAAIVAYPVIILIAANLLPYAVVSIGALMFAPFLLRAAIGLGDYKLASWLGALSFPLYAVHQPILRLFRYGDPVFAIAIALLAGVGLMVLAELPKRIRVYVRPRM